MASVAFVWGNLGYFLLHLPPLHPPPPPGPHHPLLLHFHLHLHHHPQSYPERISYLITYTVRAVSMATEL